ncbi:MAG: hypothetical protein AB7G13_36320 [Lautropia sp.]
MKRYSRQAIEKHASFCSEPIASFEYRRNQACYSVPELQRHVAQPVAFHVGPDRQWLLQQRVDGRLCSEVGASWTNGQWHALRRRLLAIAALAHRAGIYDLDLHPRNVILLGSGDQDADVVGEPVFFDFNLVPFTERQRPTLLGWLYRLGLVEANERDLRRIRQRFRC